MLNNYFYLAEKIIPRSMCEHIVKTAPWPNAMDAKIARGEEAQVNAAFRKTEIAFLNPMSIIGCVLQTHIRAINKADWGFDIDGCEDIQIAKYEKGGHYTWHIDTFPPDQANKQRKLTAIAFLSNPDSFEGGNFELAINAGLPPKLPQGSIIVFPSVLEHRVTPVTKGRRFTVSCWATGPAFR
jgi:PKHD-type hydroxylase